MTTPKEVTFAYEKDTNNFVNYVKRLKTYIHVCVLSIISRLDYLFSYIHIRFQGRGF